jgi:alpha-glucosidase
VVPDGDWYLHLFDVTQPDLNWSNQEVRAEFLDILRFWLEIGLSGFRVDVANGLAKDPDYIDVGEITNFRDPIWLTVEHPFAARPELQQIVEGWRPVIDEFQLRRELGLAHAPLEWVEQQGDVIAYRRGGIVCQVNFGPEPVMPVSGRVIISSGDATRELPPDTAIWVLASGADAMSD